MGAGGARRAGWPKSACRREWRPSAVAGRIRVTGCLLSARRSPRDRELRLGSRGHHDAGQTHALLRRQSRGAPRTIQSWKSSCSLQRTVAPSSSSSFLHAVLTKSALWSGTPGSIQSSPFHGARTSTIASYGSGVRLGSKWKFGGGAAVDLQLVGRNHFPTKNACKQPGRLGAIPERAAGTADNRRTRDGYRSHQTIFDVAPRFNCAARTEQHLARSGPLDQTHGSLVGGAQ